MTDGRSLTPVRLGPGRIHVSRVVMGCMWSPTLSEADITRLVHAACDHGISSFDTAPLYDFHRSEEMLGRAVADRRSRVQILTKAGLRWDAEHGQVLFSFHDAQGRLRAVRKDSRPVSLRGEVEASLRRLGVEHIDLIQVHHPDVVTPIADSLGELARMRDAGLIRAIGVSNYSPEQLANAVHALGPSGLDCLQCEYSLVERWAEAELLPACRAAGVGVLAYSPLAKGMLAGTSGWRKRSLGSANRGGSHASRLSRAVVQGAVQLALGPLARSHGVEVGQIALAWLLAQPGLTGVVVGASTRAQVISNAAAADITLSQDEVAEVGARFARLRLPLRILRRIH